jgi:hypothetical protein
MEKNDTLLDKNTFNSVWQRVRPTPPELPRKAETAALAESITAPAVIAESATPAPIYIEPTQTESVAVVESTSASPVEVLPAQTAKREARKPSRVMEVENEQGVLEAQQLRDFMDRESEAERYYCCIANMCSGQVRQTCLCLAQSCRRQIRRLGTRYYMLTGETYCPCSSVVPVNSAREALRYACRDEAALCADYLAAAESADASDPCGAGETYSAGGIAARSRLGCAGRLLEGFIADSRC